MKVIYFHGFASSPISEKVNMLKDAGFDVAAPAVNIDPIIAERELIKFIEAHLKYDGKLVVMGTSLGGFWAARMGSYFDITTILLNPALHPEESLKKHVGAHKNYSTGKINILSTLMVEEYAKYPVGHEDEVKFRTYFISDETPIEPCMAKKFVFTNNDHHGMSVMPEIIAYLKHLDRAPSIDPTAQPI